MDLPLLWLNPERHGRRAALQAGLLWETVNEGFVGGRVMIDLTGTALIKARSLQPGQAVSQKMILLLFRNFYFSLVGKPSMPSSCPGTETSPGGSSVFPHGACPLLGRAELSYPLLLAL